MLSYILDSSGFCCRSYVRSYIKDTIISSPSTCNCLIHCEISPWSFEASMINLSLLCCFSDTNETNNMEERGWISVGGPVILFLKHGGYVWFQTCSLVPMQDNSFFLFLDGMILSEQVLYIEWFVWGPSLCCTNYSLYSFSILYIIFLSSSSFAPKHWELWTSSWQHPGKGGGTWW